MEFVVRFWFSGLIGGLTKLIGWKFGLNGFVVEHWQCTVFFYYVFFLFFLIFATAFLTSHERALIADIQARKGPRKVGYNGFLQAIADAFKLVEKESIEIRYAHIDVFKLAAYMSFFVSGLFWMAIPFGFDSFILKMNFSSFVLFNLSILHLFTIAFAGWASYSKYACLGSLRTTAQLVSYDISIAMTYIYLFKFIKTLNIIEIYTGNSKIGSFGFFLVIIGMIFFSSSLAELSRHPFDLPEAESELVAGYNTEYSSIRFALFFLGEYLNLFSYAFLFCDIFFGGNSMFWLFVKIAIVIYIIIKIRALIPRYRYDQLMSLCWKCFLPVLSSAVFYSFVLEHVNV